MSDIHHPESKIDLKEDCKIALYRIGLLKDQLVKLLNYRHILPENRSIARFLKKSLSTLENHYTTFENTLPTMATTGYSLRFRLSQRLRSLEKSIISLFTNQSWQSPSARNIFRQGITPPQSSYEYHRINFKKEEIEETCNNFHTHINNTQQDSMLLNSGMGAFSVINAALHEKIAHKKQYILIGENSYYEIKRFFKKNKSIYHKIIKEIAIDSFMKHIKKENCVGIHLDLISNNFNSIHLNIKTILQSLFQLNKEEPFYLVLNTTLAGVNFQLNSYLENLPWPNYLHVVMYRSLHPYDQYGDDKVSAGLLTCIAKDSENKLPIANYQSLLGVNCPEINLYSLCLNQELSNTRYERIRRNGKILYEKYRYESNYLIKFSECGLLFLKLNGDNQEKERYNSYIEKIISVNFNNGLYIFESNSFGFNYTHIMLVDTETNNHYIRISPGMECIDDIKKIIL